MLLFLDFDGVLHPDRCTNDQFFCRLPLLEAWLREHPAVDVVISSSWRVAHPIDELREVFSEDLRSRIVGITPILRREQWAVVDGELEPVRFEREAEVRRWLQLSDAPWRPWVALDDMAWMFPPFCRNIVATDPAVGLTESELDKASQRLGL